MTVPLYDTQKFASQVLLLMNNEEMRLKLREKALRQAELFDWKHVANDFAPLVNSVVY